MEEMISKIGALDRYREYLSNNSDISNFNESLTNFKSALEKLEIKERIFQIGIVGQMKTGSIYLEKKYYQQQQLQ